MNDNKHSFPEMTIQFGDFTEAELKTKTTTKQDQTVWCSHSYLHLPPCSKTIPISTSISISTQTSTWVVFGSFTDEECMKIQDLTTTSSLSRSPRTRTHVPPRKRCFRCGYNSHTIENCVATRHRSGEYIGYPGSVSIPSYPRVQTHFNPHYPSSPSTSSGFSNLIPGDFIFNISDLREWMLHDYEYRLNTYMDSLNQRVSTPSNDAQFQDQEDHAINEYLYLDYLTTNLLLEKQASNYFQNLYKIQS